jgi:nucleoside-diphosphate-sugar epimerase
LARYLVTGGAGFIGSNLVEALVRRGHVVRVLDNFSTGRRENLLAFLDRAELVEGDVADCRVARRAAQGMDFVLHHAALPSVQRSIEDPQATHRANAEGTLSMLCAARECGIRRLVYASSSSVYGSSPELPKSEDQPTAPASPYAASKLAGEAYALAFHRAFRLEVVALRYFNVFGPHQDPMGSYAPVIPRFLYAALRGERPVIFGDGRQSRDFTFVENVVEANLSACREDRAVGEVINIAGGARTDLLGLLGIIGRLVGRRIEPDLAPPRAGEVRHSEGDIGKAQRILGYSPRVGLEEGLRRTLEFLASSA